MPELMLSLASPSSLQSMLAVLLALFAKDFIVGILRRVSRQLLSDKDKHNDVIGVALNQAADSIERVAVKK